jgi:hypothetical protein
MKLREVDKSKIYIGYLIGYKNNKPIYGNPIATKAQIGLNAKGRMVQNAYGNSQQYDLRLQFEIDDINKYINENTVFWINIYPKEGNANYKVLKINNWQNGILDVYCTHIEESHDSFYVFDFQYGIYEVQGIIDYDNMKLLVPHSNLYFGTIDSCLWLEEPVDENDLEHLYQIYDFDQDDRYKIYYLKKYESNK